MELYDKKWKKLDGTYKKILSNLPHEKLYDKEGSELQSPYYKKALAKNPCLTLYNKKGDK